VPFPCFPKLARQAVDILVEHPLCQLIRRDPRLDPF
jgi:hypothetical protein